MKPITTLLFLLILSATPARADESLSGRVVDLDLSKGLMVVAPFRARHHMMHMGQGKGHGMGRGEVVVLFSEGALPEFVTMGAVIRIEGDFLPQSQTVFRAGGFLPFKGHDNDPTGVRERLGKHRNRCEPNSPSDMGSHE